MKGTRIIAVFVALATVITTLSVLASCGGEKEPEFTVPHITEISETIPVESSYSAESSAPAESSATESTNGETVSSDTESNGTETTGAEVPVPVDFSTIPLPGEEGYKDRIHITNGQHEGIGGVVFGSI